MGYNWKKLEAVNGVYNELSDYFDRCNAKSYSNLKFMLGLACVPFALAATNSIFATKGAGVKHQTYFIPFYFLAHTHLRITITTPFHESYPLWVAICRAFSPLITARTHAHSS